MSGEEGLRSVGTPERRKSNQSKPLDGSPRRRSTDVLDATETEDATGGLPGLPGVPAQWTRPETPRSWMTEEQYAAEQQRSGAGAPGVPTDEQWTESLYAERWVSLPRADPQPVPDAASKQRRGLRLTSPQLFFLVDVVCLTLPGLWNHMHYRAVISTALLSCLFFWAAGLYRHRLQALVLDDLPALLMSMLAASAITATAGAVRHPSQMVAGYLLLAFVTVCLVVLGRTLACFAIRMARRRGVITHPTVIVGTGTLADRMVATVQGVPDYGLEVVGYLADRATFGTAVDSTPYLGRVNALAGLISRMRIEVVLVADGGFSEKELAALLRDDALSECEVLAVPRLHAGARQRHTSDMIGSVPVVRIGPHGRDGARWMVKRLFDIFVSSAALLLLSPILALCALAVRIDDGPGVIFRQVRVGRDGKEFEILKFRSLRPLTEEESQQTWSVSNDDRMSRLGKFMRKTSLDELPQLWTILRGEMSIVGPRPERPHFVEKFGAEQPDYLLRHRVPCGLTGLAQVNGMRGDTSIAERASFDNYYIENWSLWLDVKIIFRTFGEVLFGSGG